MFRSFFSLFMVWLFLLVTACGSSGPARVESEPVAEPDFQSAVFRLGYGDVVKVSVWKNPEMSVEVPVRPDGFISLPLLGDVPAGGRTPQETAEDIEQRLTRYLRSPRVSLIVTQLNSAEFMNRVRVVGAVAAPKSLTWREGMTVLDLVLEAGGFNEFAAPESSKLYRKADGSTRIYPVFLESILEDGRLKTNYDLYPGDVVSVPERRF